MVVWWVVKVGMVVWWVGMLVWWLGIVVWWVVKGGAFK